MFSLTVDRDGQWEAYLYTEGIVRLCALPYSPPAPVAGAGSAAVEEELVEPRQTAQLDETGLPCHWQLVHLSNTSLKDIARGADSQDLADAPEQMQRPCTELMWGGLLHETIRAGPAETVTRRGESSRGHQDGQDGQDNDHGGHAERQDEATEACAETNCTSVRIATARESRCDSQEESASGQGAPDEHNDVGRDQVARFWRDLIEIAEVTARAIRRGVATSTNETGCSGCCADSAGASSVAGDTPGDAGISCGMFQVLGLDVMLDAAHQPWLLEVNARPALTGTEPEMKQRLLRAILRQLPRATRREDAQRASLSVGTTRPSQATAFSACVEGQASLVRLACFSE